jgi:hypothetical protein
MDQKDNGEDELKKHSLPGTNQAGDGPEPSEKENKPADQVAPQQDQLEKHSLPGTNQAGKQPDSCDTSDAIRPNGA